MGSNRTSRNFTPKSDEGSAYVRPSVPVSDKPTFTSSEEDEHLRGTGVSVYTVIINSQLNIYNSPILP